MSKWISVKDRIPEPTRELGGSEFSDNCLIVNSYGCMFVAPYMYPWRNIDLLGWSNANCKLMDKDEITHWQPLPEVPKDECK